MSPVNLLLLCVDQARDPKRRGLLKCHSQHPVEENSHLGPGSLPL